MSRETRTRHARAATRRLVVELSTVGAAGLVYFGVRKVTEGSVAKAHANAVSMHAFEHRHGIDFEHSIQSLALDHEWLRTFANWIYIWGHWPVITAVAIGLFIWNRSNYVRLRNAVFISGLIGFVFFYFVPMEPPRLADVGLVDTVTRWSGSYRVLQPPRYTNIYAAMPSLHFGWDLLAGVALFMSSRNLLLRALGIAMPLCMAFAVVATANHWILDVVVALCVVTVAGVISEIVRVRRT
jgi:hypothetical protein